MTKSTNNASSSEDGKSRLEGFMSKNGLFTTTDLAQVFRVGQSTISRWIGQAKKDILENVLPGPAMILFELIEDGFETPDLIRMRSLAAIRENPKTDFPTDTELQWTIEIPTNARYGAKIVSETGHYITVHSRWFSERLSKLEGSVDDLPPNKKRDVQRLVEKYGQARDDLTSLPR